MRRNILLILLGLLLTSCGATYQLSTINHEPEYIDDIRVDVIENEFELNRKLRFDSQFRWDFARYAQSQDLRWHYDFYFTNRMYRSPFASPFDFYWHSTEYWWNWSNNYPFGFGFNHWNRFGFYYGYNRWSPFGYDRWGYNNTWGWNYGYGYGFNDWGWRNRMNDYAWENRNKRNVAYVNGRRGSNVVVTPNGGGSRGSDVVIRNRGRNNNVNISEDVRRYRDKIVPRKDIDIDDIARDLNNGRKVRTYENPKNIPNNRIRNYNRIENNNNIRNYNLPRNNNNNIRSTPPPTRVSPPVRSNISRGSSNVGRSSSSVIRRNE